MRISSPIPLAACAGLIGFGFAGRADAQQYSDERIASGFGAGTSSYASVAHGDVDADGATDLIVTESGGTTFVYRGGSGAFSLVESISAGDEVVVIDLNSDGRADLLGESFVSIGYYPGQVGAQFGNFVSIQSKGNNEVFWNKRVADVNGDGKLDVLVSMSTDQFGSTGVLRWYAGNGLGAFSNPQSTQSTPYPIEFTLGDFDADGDVDAAATGPSGGAPFVFSNTGSGFATPQPIPPGIVTARYLASGDFDADGIDDLASYGINAAWYRGGVGGLSLVSTFGLSGGAVFGRALHAADLENDGDSDLVLTELSGTQGKVWRCLGTPGTGLSSPAVLIARACTSVDAFEFDGRPGLDFAYTELSFKWPSLRAGDGAGGSVPPLDILATGSCLDSDSSCAGDLDRDGHLDLAYESGEWARGVGDGTFQPIAPLNARPSELVDLDGDGRLDAVGASAGCGPLVGVHAAIQGAGIGPSFGPTTLVTAGPYTKFVLADLDVDGDLDIASGSTTGIVTNLNLGTGAFASTVPTGITALCSALAAGDMNTDGIPDLAFTSYLIDPFTGSFLFSNVGIGISNGTGGLASSQSVPVFNSVMHDLVVEDVNGDGDSDLAWASGTFAGILAVYGNGFGGVGGVNFVMSFDGVSQLDSLAFSDIDGDGVRDLIGGGYAHSHVSIARGTGSGYTQWRDIAAGNRASKLLPYDFDSDGQVDLAWSDGGATRIVINQRLDPAGATPFGVGTSGCRGRVSIGSASAPELGNAAFRIVANNLPPVSTGWFLLTTGSSAAGFDPFGVGALFHIDPLPPSGFFLVPIATDSGGQTSVALPIAQVPAYAGLTFTAQFAHFGTVGHDCSSSPYSLVTSRGLGMTIQP